MIVNMCTMNQSYRTILMEQLKNLKFDKYLYFGLFFPQSIKLYNYFQSLYDFNSNTINAVLEGALLGNVSCQIHIKPPSIREIQSK